MINLFVNGIPYTDFVSAKCSLSVSSVANDFSFVASAVKGFPPFRLDDGVSVSIDGEKKLTGHIDEVIGIDEEGTHTVTYSGRDKTGDLIDSQLFKFDDLKAGGDLTLKRIIEVVLANIQLDLKVIDNLNPAVFNPAEDLIDAKDGTGALGLILEYARKRQALISSDPDGNIVITQSSPVDSGVTLQRLVRGDNNILSQSWNLDVKQEFNRYLLRGQLDPRALNFAGETDVTSIEEQGGTVTNPDSRVGRQRVIIEAKGYSDEQLRDRAKWSAQIAKSKATRFNCSVRGHQKPGNTGTWGENTLAQINSELADISRKMLIDTLTFSQGEGEPTITQLEFVEKDVFTINEKILSQRPVGNQNDVFGSLG